MTNSSGPDAQGATSADSPGFASTADESSQFGADEDESSSDDDLSQD